MKKIIDKKEVGDWIDAMYEKFVYLLFIIILWSSYVEVYTYRFVFKLFKVINQFVSFNVIWERNEYKYILPLIIVSLIIIISTINA